MRYLIFICIVLASGWLKSSNSIPIDLDEIAWIHDAQVYQWRVTNNWEHFNWNQKKKSMDWTSEDFRLFDQPHFAKYIYGFALSTANIVPWQNTNRENNFRLFIAQKVSGHYLLTNDASSEIFGHATIESIKLCRWISLFFGLTTLLILFLFLTYKFSLLMSSITLFLLTTNPTIFYNLHLATSDSISLFFIVISLILFYLLFFENHLTNKAGFILLFLSAVSSAFAVSTKTNSWLLIYVLLLGQLLFCDRGRLVNWKETVTKTCLWFFLFVGTYIYLQPELWTSPTAGFVRFFSQRLAQQNQFVHSFGTVGFFEYHKWLVELSAQSNHVVITIIKVTVLLIALIKFIKIFLTNFSKTNFLIKQLIIVTPIWLFFFFSARIGFDRYAIWPIIILAIFSSWILTRKKLLI